MIDLMTLIISLATLMLILPLLKVGYIQSTSLLMQSMMVYILVSVCRHCPLYTPCALSLAIQLVKLCNVHSIVRQHFLPKVGTVLKLKCIQRNVRIVHCWDVAVYNVHSFIMTVSG